MSSNECLICCEAFINKSLDVQNAETLFRTLFGHHLDFVSDTDSFQLLFQSATYCLKCVGKVQDLGVLFRELEALEKKLDNEKIQIKNQLRQSFVFYEWNGSTDSSVDNHNQKLRNKIVTRLNELEVTTDPLSTEDQQLLQSSIPVFSEAEIPSIDDIFSPPSPTHSVTSVNIFDEEKFLPQELSSVGLELTPQLKSTDSPLGLGVTNRDSQYTNKLPVIILHRLNDVETNTVLTRMRNKTRKRYAEVKPSKIRKLRDKRIKNSSPRRRSIVHQHQSINETVEIEKPESNTSSQPKTSKKRTRIKLKEPRTRCPFYPSCITTFGKIDEEIKLKAHVRKHHEGMKNGYLCESENCGHSFGTLKELQAHESWKHKGIHPYICSHCEEVCTSEHHLKLHIAINHKPEEIKSKCEFCGDGFVDQRRLTLHLMKHTKKRPFMCEICSKTFNTNVVLKYHQSKHHPEETLFDPYKCEECGKIFAAPQNLRDHIKRLHRREFKYHCEICGHGSLTPSGLKYHINNRHSNDRNFKCEQCGMTFKVNHKLKVHIRTHTGERPYVCKTESCGKTFTDSGKLRRHELIHSKEQCHECKVCGKTFPVMNYLYIHMRSHNKKKIGESKING